MESAAASVAAGARWWSGAGSSRPSPGSCPKASRAITPRCTEAPETLGAVCADGRCGGGLVCRVGRCVAPGARVGAACVPYDRNACGPRLACVWARDRDGGVAARCAHAPAIGARCPEGRCAGGAECLPYVVDGRCEPLFCEPGAFWICEID